MTDFCEKHNRGFQFACSVCYEEASKSINKMWFVVSGDDISCVVLDGPFETESEAEAWGNKNFDYGPDDDEPSFYVVEAGK